MAHVRIQWPGFSDVGKVESCTVSFYIRNSDGKKKKAGSPITITGLVGGWEGDRGTVCFLSGHWA